MANGSVYDFGAAFAGLTGILEDALVGVVEGQSSFLELDDRLRLVSELEQHLEKANLMLKEIKTALA